MKIRPLGAELFRTDGRTGMMKLIVALRNFANAPKNDHCVCVCVCVCVCGFLFFYFIIIIITILFFFIKRCVYGEYIWIHFSVPGIR
jgi:hypothetical protein